MPLLRVTGRFSWFTLLYFILDDSLIPWRIFTKWGTEGEFFLLRNAHVGCAARRHLERGAQEATKTPAKPSGSPLNSALRHGIALASPTSP